MPARTSPDVERLSVRDAVAAICTPQLSEGAIPSFLPPTGAGEQLVVRVAGAGTMAGTPGSVSLAAGLAHQ